MLTDILRFEVPDYLPATLCQRLFLTLSAFAEDRVKLNKERETIYTESYLRNFKRALKRNHYYWILEWLPHVENLNKGFQYAVKYNKLPLARYFFEKGKTYLKEKSDGDIPLGFGNRIYHCDTKSAFKYMSSYDNIWMYFFLSVNGGDHWTEALYYAISHNNKERYLHFMDKYGDKKHDLDYGRVIGAVIHSKNPEFIKGIHNKGITPSNNELLAAAEVGNLELILERYPNPRTPSIIVRAARYGQLNVVKHFIGIVDGCEDIIFKTACYSGNEELVDYSLDYVDLNSDLLSAAIAEAATTGKINIIDKLMILANSVGISINLSLAIFSAAIEGRKSTIKYLSSYSHIGDPEYDFSYSLHHCRDRGQSDMIEEIIKLKK